MSIGRLLLAILDAVSAGDFSSLSMPSIFALDGFLYGYGYVDGRVMILHPETDSVIAGPSSAGVCQRAYFAAGNHRDALIRAATVVRDYVVACAPPAEPHAAPVIDVVRPLIVADRAMSILGEATVMRLADFIAGHTCALLDLVPEQGQGQLEQLRAFEEWLQLRTGFRVPWHEYIRLAYGPYVGLHAFVDKWDQFTASAIN